MKEFVNAIGKNRVDEGEIEVSGYCCCIHDQEGLFEDRKYEHRL